MTDGDSAAPWWRRGLPPPEDFDPALEALANVDRRIPTARRKAQLDGTWLERPANVNRDLVAERRAARKERADQLMREALIRHDVERERQERQNAQASTSNDEKEVTR